MEYRTQTVHTIKFQRMEHGTWPSELKIEETDNVGSSKLKTLEHHSYGIVRHLGLKSMGGAQPNILPITVMITLGSLVKVIPFPSMVPTRNLPQLGLGRGCLLQMVLDSILSREPPEDLAAL